MEQKYARIAEWASSICREKERIWEVSWCDKIPPTKAVIHTLLGLFPHESQPQLLAQLQWKLLWQALPLHGEAWEACSHWHDLEVDELPHISIWDKRNSWLKWMEGPFTSSDLTWLRVNARWCTFMCYSYGKSLPYFACACELNDNLARNGQEQKHLNIKLLYHYRRQCALVRSITSTLGADIVTHPVAFFASFCLLIDSSLSIENAVQMVHALFFFLGGRRLLRLVCELANLEKNVSKIEFGVCQCSLCSSFDLGASRLDADNLEPWVNSLFLFAQSEKWCHAKQLGSS